MRKIEEAAWNYSPGGLDRIVQQRLDFIAGARYVLDALTSEEAVRAAAFELDLPNVFMGGPSPASMSRARKALDAVRRRIEE